MLKALIFDLDGTLIDSLADIAAAINRMLAARGHPLCEASTFTQMIGDGMEKLVERALPVEHRTEESITSGVAEYRAFYDQMWHDHTAPYPGIMEALLALQARGVKLGVISNKHHRFTVPMTEHFFGKEIFAHILGQREGVQRKPAPDGAVEMAAALGVPLAECGYVGDSGIDMQFAKNSGMRAIGVSWGFRSVQELRENGADVILNSAVELLGSSCQ